MSDLARVAELVRRESGMVIGPPQFPGLAAALARVEAGMTPAGFLSRIQQPLERSHLVSALIDEVTIKETYLFRAQRELEAVDWLAALTAARELGVEGVRIWVSACASGEEAYTLAILAKEALSPVGGSVSVLATDLSRAALRQAEEARFSARSARAVPSRLRERYFLRDGDRMRVCEPIRRMVRFRMHNLVRDPVPPVGEVPFDVIACRNVLIYFDLETVAKVIDRLELGLREGGMLILGAADRLTGTASRLAGNPPVKDRRRPSAPRVPAPQAGDARSGERRRPATRRPRARRAPEQATAHPRRRAQDRIEDALEAANSGHLELALQIASSVIETHPLDPSAHYIRGLAALGTGQADVATGAFRRALYVDPSFALPAFELGRAYEEQGNRTAALRAYQQALRTLDADDPRYESILGYVELSDVAATCRARVRALGRSA